jgi:DegV family protein with EDD domain
VTDSTADLDDDEQERLGIRVVPLTVFFGDEALLDRVDIQPDEFYVRLRESRVFPRTSQPAVARFQEAYTDLAERGATEIISIHISSRLSGTLNAAQAAASTPPSGCRVTTLDSRTVAGGLGGIVRRAAEVAEQGGDTAQALGVATAMIQRHHISILLDTLEYLQRGGRIGRARALLGSLLNIKPIVHVVDGEVGAAERVRSRARGIERVFEHVTAAKELAAVTVQHTGSAGDAESLARRIRLAAPGIPVDVRWIGPVVGAYVGPNGVGAVTIERIPNSQ